MVFNAAVTNNDDHPRNHALLRHPDGWRLSPVYDVVPVPVVSLERRRSRDALYLAGGQTGTAGIRRDRISLDTFGKREGDRSRDSRRWTPRDHSIYMQECRREFGARDAGWRRRRNSQIGAHIAT
jgi:hypothetical protein